jgi:hypothetical protein
VSAPILASDSASLTPARSELARTNAQIAVLKAERDEAQRLLDRWHGPESEVTTVEAQLAQLRSQCQADRAAWNDTGCVGDPPADPPDLLTLERARARLCEQLGANDSALQTAASAVQRTTNELAALSLQQRSAHLRATIEAVRTRLAEHAVPVLIAGLNELAVLQSIATVLARPDDLEATAASREIDQLIAIARRSYGVRGDVEAAQCFLNELAGDPSARIPDPGPAAVERLDPGILRGGVQDGSKYLNLSPPVGSPVNPDRAWWDSNEPGWASPFMPSPGSG